MTKKSEKKSYKVIGRFHGAAKGDILTLNAADVEASKLLGSTLEEVAGEAASEAVESPSGTAPSPSAAPEPQTPASVSAAAAKTDLAKGAGGPPMPTAKPAVAPAPGK